MTSVASDSSTVAGRAGKGVAASAVAFWLIAFTFLEIFFVKNVSLPQLVESFSTHGVIAITLLFSALEFLELYLLWKLFRQATPMADFSLFESIVMLGVAGAAMLALRDHPQLVANLFPLYFLARFWRSPGYRIFAMALLAFAAQYLVNSGPFSIIHSMVG